MKLDLAACMDEIARRVKFADPDADPPVLAVMLRAYGYPNLTITPPAFVVGYPPDLTPTTFTEEGSWRAAFPCWAVFGDQDTESGRNTLSGFLGGLQDRINGDAPGIWSSAMVTMISLETVANADGTEYLAARFNVDVLT